MKSKRNHFLALLRQMSEKELKARYKNTVFGFLWVVVNPVLQMLVIGFIFRFFISVPVENYMIYLLIGLLVWNFFSLSLSKATPSIVNERSLIKKALFPREVIPLSIVISNLIHLLIAFGLLLIPIIYYQLSSLFNIVYFILGVVVLFLFTAGLSLLTSALNVRFRDINFMVQAMLVVWFYATPVIYSLNIVPVQYYWIWMLNPMTMIVHFFQKALISAPVINSTIVMPNILIIITVVFFGIRIFKKESKNFDDWI